MLSANVTSTVHYMIVCVLFAIKCQRSEHVHEVWCACPRFSVPYFHYAIFQFLIISMVLFSYKVLISNSNYIVLIDFHVV